MLWRGSLDRRLKETDKKTEREEDAGGTLEHRQDPPQQGSQFVDDSGRKLAVLQPLFTTRLTVGTCWRGSDDGEGHTHTHGFFAGRVIEALLKTGANTTYDLLTTHATSPGCAIGSIGSAERPGVGRRGSPQATASRRFFTWLRKKLERRLEATTALMMIFSAEPNNAKLFGNQAPLYLSGCLRGSLRGHGSVGKPRCRPPRREL